MRIAYVIINANRSEGTSRAIVEVAERMASGNEVHLYARRAIDFDDRRLQWHPMKGPHRPSVIELSHFARQADRALRKQDFDIIHCAGVNTTLADVYTVQTIQVEKQRAMHGVDAHQDASLPRRLTRELYDRRVISGEKRCYTAFGPRGIRGFAPVASGTLRELLAHYPVHDAEVSIIPNGADLQRFNPSNRSNSRKRVLSQHQLASNDFLLLFSGGEWRRKGLDLAIRAVGHIDDARVKLIVAGRDPIGQELQELPMKLGIGNRVVFAGFCSKIEDYYAACDLFVFPTAYEAFSLATIEAAASGLPVLMSDVSGAKELLGSGEAGLIVERNSVEIANAILNLRKEPATLSRLRVGARSICERQYSWDRVAELTNQLYRRVIARR